MSGPGWDERWAELAAELTECAAREPRPLQQWPDPRVGGRAPPVEIRLAAWARETAAHLHERFGDAVRLRVGALPFPLRTTETPVRRAEEPAEDWPPGEFRAELDGPLVVASGHTVRHSLLLTRLREPRDTLHTNGQLTVAVVDPATGERVGGYSGAQKAPHVAFHLDPGVTVAVPLLVGTASYVPSLGYAVPPGEWAVRTDLHLDGGRRVRTPLLALTVTPGAAPRPAP